MKSNKNKGTFAVTLHPLLPATVLSGLASDLVIVDVSVYSLTMYHYSKHLTVLGDQQHCEYYVYNKVFDH